LIFEEKAYSHCIRCWEGKVRAGLGVPQGGCPTHLQFIF
jgi:hypothetical protein